MKQSKVLTGWRIVGVLSLLLGVGALIWTQMRSEHDIIEDVKSMEGAPSEQALAPTGDAEAAVRLDWSELEGETTTLVLSSDTPHYAALILRKADGSLELSRTMIFVDKGKEQRFSLGTVAYEGTYCISVAATPALLQETVAQLQSNPPALTCAAPLAPAESSAP